MTFLNHLWHRYLSQIRKIWWIVLGCAVALASSFVLVWHLEVATNKDLSGPKNLFYLALAAFILALSLPAIRTFDVVRRSASERPWE